MSVLISSRPLGSGVNAFFLLTLVTATMLLLSSSSLVEARTGPEPARDHNHHHPYGGERRTRITDFRYSTARIDGIARLFNDTLIVISNGYYWVLDKGETPNYFNAKGHVHQLYPGFSHVDTIWIDPYNDISPQIYLAQNTRRHGLGVVCQEFFEEFKNNSSFCHLPVNAKWKMALKDLDFNRPLNAVTWRNRTKDKEGGFWVFFQGKKMITIDPYEMDLRYTYDINKWMAINETITAAYYDYHRAVYHFFFDNNRYRTWTVNVTYQNRLPMSWDRAFLHGTLSPLMTINRDFFGFPANEVYPWSQPNYERVQPKDKADMIPEKKPNDHYARNRPSTVPPVTSPRWISPATGINRPSTTSWQSSHHHHGSIRPTNVPATNSPPTLRPQTTSTMSDVDYITPQTKTNILDETVASKNGRFTEVSNNDLSELKPEAEASVNSGEASYQKQLLQLQKQGVLDFGPEKESSINSASRQNSFDVLAFSVCLALIASLL